MPTLTEAYDFVNDPDETITQLRVACQAAGLDQSGNVEDLRDRLNRYLADFSPEEPVVCLNPEPPGAEP